MSDQTEPQKVNIAESGTEPALPGADRHQLLWPAAHRCGGLFTAACRDDHFSCCSGPQPWDRLRRWNVMDVPASSFTVADADEVLAQADIDTEGSRIQLRDSESGSFVKVQVRSIGDAEAREVRQLLADGAGTSVDDINVNVVSASWGVTSPIRRFGHL